MQEVFANSLLQSISESRFGPYRRPGTSEADGFARYLWNVALGESLYPVLQGLEVPCVTAFTMRRLKPLGDPIGLLPFRWPRKPGFWR